MVATLNFQMPKVWSEFDKFVWYAENVIFPAMGYEPTPEQWKFHRAKERVRLVAGGERGGKSRASAADMSARATYMAYLEDEKEKKDKDYRRQEQLYWIIGPDYTQPRAEFEYVLNDLTTMGFPMIGKPSMPRGGSAPWSVHIAKIGEITTKTSADLKKIASYAPDGVLMAEAAQQEYDAYLKCRGRVAEKRGWLLMSGTFESSLGWYAETFTAWKNGFGTNRSFSLPTWSNTKIYPGGREDAEIKALEAVTPEDLFYERYGAVPFKPHTLIFREFSYEKNVKEWCKFNPDLPVEIAVDVGYDPGAYHVSALQIYNPDGEKEQIWQVDEIHEWRHVAEDIIKIAKNRVWWKNVVGGVMDVAGRAHQGQESHIEIWNEKANLYLRSERVGVSDGIERHRTFLLDPETKKPRLFHNPENIHTLREYTQYKRKPYKDGMIQKDEPIDAHNHAMKPLAYYLYDRYGPVHRERRKKTKVATL